MSHDILSLSAILVFIIFTLAYIFFRRKKKHDLDRKILTPTDELKALDNLDSLEIIQGPVQLPLPARLSSLSFKEGPASWKKAMKILGQKLQAQGVTHIILLHGTFAGDDPLDICANTFEQKGWQIKWRYSINPLRHLQGLYRMLKDGIIGNVGNFTSAYSTTLENGLNNKKLGPQIQVHCFHWPSGNHHLARIRGLMCLIDRILSLKLQREERVLMVGHSHAGQLFAALTQMTNRPAHFSQILAKEIGLCEDPDAFRHKLETLLTLNLDISTWGSAPRYKWNLPSHWRLVHLLNFRKIPPRFPNPWKLLTAKYGDSIYLLAGPGSDTWAPFRRDRKINRTLDSFLGVGLSLRQWWFSIQSGIKIHNQGRHFYINYHDAGLSHFFKSFLGHGIYTHPGLMLFNFETMIKGLYPEEEKKKLTD